MSLVHETLEQLSQMPQFTGVDSLRDVGPAAVAMATGVYGLYRFGTDHLRDPQVAGGLAGADPVALERAVQHTPGRLERWRKIGAVGLASVSLTFLGGDLLNPTYKGQEPNPDGGAVIVVDASHSMRYPNDMDGDKTRLSVVYDAIQDVVDELPEGAPAPAIILATQTTERVVPGNSSPEEIEAVLDEASTRPTDKANLTPAIMLGQQLLHDNNVEAASLVIITDGTMSDRPETIATLAAGPEGIETTVIVPGTDEGSYNISGIPGGESAAAASVAFAGEAGITDPHTATSAAGIRGAVNDAMGQSILKDVTRPWDLFRNIAILTGGLAGLKLIFGNNRGLRKGPIKRSKGE